MPAALKAGIAYFGVVFGAGFALGVLRTLVVIPRVGELTAILMELPVILALSWAVSRWLIARFGVGGTMGSRLAMGGVAFAVLMAAEAGLAVFMIGRTLAQHAASYRAVAEQVGLAGQIAFAMIPAVQLLVPGKRP